MFMAIISDFVQAVVQSNFSCNFFHLAITFIVVGSSKLKMYNIIIYSV